MEELSEFQSIPRTFEYYQEHWNPTWSEWIWLPPGVHWEHLASEKYAKPHHLAPALYLVVVIVLVRLALEGFLFPIFARRLGIRQVNTKYAKNPTLEEAYAKVNGHASPKYVKELVKRTGMNEREIQRWLRRKKNSLIATPTKKFSECLFKVLYYSSVFLYGVIVLYNRPWAWDLHQAYHNLPMHPIDGHITNYYIIQLAYYTACLVTLPVDNRRKDFVELVIHHIATVLLIAFSWYTNLWKVGTLVMVIHDAADVFLEIAKTFNYAGYQEIANHGFTVFAISFFFTRLVLFPIVIKSVIEKPVEIIFYEESLYDYVTKGHVVVSHVTFSVLLCILLALHVFWFSIIAKMAMSMITEPVSKDVRSDDEYGFSTDEEQENARKQAITNAQERKENKKEE